MSDEFENLNSRIPDFQSALVNRIVSKNTDGGNPPVGTVDPYQLMLQKKRGETAEINPDTIVKWPEESVKKLQDYCSKMGIIGFNSGRMHPLAALAMLQKEYGTDYTNIPLDERIPAGHEKIGTKSGYGPNYPYTDAMCKKQILHG